MAVDYFDITMTATLRPELLEVTLQSHYENLFKEHIKKARLLINVDMVGAEEDLKYSKVCEVKRVIQKFPFSSVKMNISREPHFPTAFLWCMSQETNREFVFHLEEDWQLVRPFNFDDMVERMLTYPRFAHLRLSAFKSGTTGLKCWNKFAEYFGGGVFIIPRLSQREIGWCGHPSLNRWPFMKEVLPFISPDHNPEKQIKGRREPLHPINQIFDKYWFGIYHPQDTSAAEVDIGRRWMVENGFVKSGNKAWFTNWEKTEGIEK